jgi:RNA-directed DNA polymerase
MIGQFFNEEFLKEYYLNNRAKENVGTDRITRESFENKLLQNIEIINTKVKDGSYRFSRYRGVMIPKKPDKPPRIIAIPTIRDKLTLSVLKEFLYVYYPNIKQELVHTKVSKIKDILLGSNFDTYIKVDIINFFPSISHDKLIEKLCFTNVDKNIVKLIEKAIECEICFDGLIDRTNKTKKTGVPQGLSISNLLAEIYLNDIDLKYNNMDNIKYFRYVDDIFILCNQESSELIFNDLKNNIEQLLNLSVHELNGKSVINSINQGFDFLGYFYNGRKFSVRESTVNKLERSIERIFLEYRKQKFENIDLFLWDLNIRITGAIAESSKVDQFGKNIKKKYGWMFFFSLVDDKALLYKLDNFIKKMVKRFKLNKKIDDGKLKSFVKTYHEILFNRFNTSYIPDFSKYTLSDKKDFLTKVLRMETNEMDDEGITALFSRYIFKTIRNLEEDVQNFS